MCNIVGGFKSSSVPVPEGDTQFTSLAGLMDGEFTVDESACSSLFEPIGADETSESLASIKHNYVIVVFR